MTQDFIGTNLDWTSQDGRPWKATAWDSSDAPRTLATNGRTAVLVTDDGRLFSSTDCSTWTPAVLPGAATGVTAEALAAFAGGYVAGGFLSTGTDSDDVPIGRPLAWWSPDGLAWHAAAVSPRPGDGFIDMQAGAHGLVGTTDTVGYIPGLQTLWASPDGRHWAPAVRAPLGLQPSGEGVGDANRDFIGDGTGSSWLDGTDQPGGGQPTLSLARRRDLVARRRHGCGGRTEMASDGPTPYLMGDGLFSSGPSGTWFGAAK